MFRLTLLAVAMAAAAGPVSHAVQGPASGNVRGVTRAFANLPGRQLWYVDSAGTGAPVVFLHAGTGSTEMWELQIPAVTSAGYRFIAYDRLGSGRSVLAPGGNPGTAADDLHALMDHLAIDRFHLVGTAAGGIVAFDYAVSYPRRLRSLVVANSIGGVQDDDYLALGRRLRPSPQFNALPPEFRELGPSYRASDAAGMARWVDIEHRSRPSSPLPSPQPNRNHLTFALLETLRVPTLLLTGDADLYAPPPVLRLFAGRIPGSESLVVPGAGHSAYWEQPDVFNRAVLAFVGRH